MTSHLNSLSDGQQFHQYHHKSPLTSTHWVIVNNSTNITSNHLSLQLIEWWSTIPPITTKITSNFNSLSDGQQFHQYNHKSPLTSTHWVIVNNSTNITTNHLSLQLIEWWSTIPPISKTMTSHINSLSDGQQFHQYQQKSPLTLTHWVMVNNSTNINKNHLSLQLIEWNCWPSLNELMWEVIVFDIGGIVDHHSMSWSERWFLLIFVELLTITQWVKVRGDFCWYWWNCWPSLNVIRWEVNFVDIGDGQQFNQYQQKSPLTLTHWVMVNNSTNINQNHLSLQLIEWWSTIPPISTTMTSHLNSLSDGQQSHQYQQKSPLTSTHWVMVNNSTNINKNHLSP